MLAFPSFGNPSSIVSRDIINVARTIITGSYMSKDVIRLSQFLYQPFYFVFGLGDKPLSGGFFIGCPVDGPIEIVVSNSRKWRSCDIFHHFRFLLVLYFNFIDQSVTCIQKISQPDQFYGFVLTNRQCLPQGIEKIGSLFSWCFKLGVLPEIWPIISFFGERFVN